MFAARVGDFHVCPMQTPPIPIPHVGGPILPPGILTVLIEKRPAATQFHMCMCVGPPDMISSGSPNVFVCGLPLALALTSMTSHGGTIVMGAFTVMVNNPAAALAGAAAAALSAAAAGAAAAAEGVAAAASAMEDVTAAADRISELQEAGDLSESQAAELASLQDDYGETIDAINEYE